MKAISITWDNQLILDKEFYNRKEKREVNKLIGKLEPQIYKSLVFTIATFGFATTKAYANSSEALNKVDKVGFEILNIIQRVGFWVAVLGCLIEIMVSVFKKGGGQKEVLSLVFKWLLIFVCFYLVPALFNFIVASFM